jgi:hypothetical protein
MRWALDDRAAIPMWKCSRRRRSLRIRRKQDDFLDVMLELRYQGEAAARLAALNKVGSLAQLPFTKPGSILMVETFYKAQLAGEDVRLALHQARVALYQSQAKTGHDWASLKAESARRPVSQILIAASAASGERACPS